MMMGSEWYAKPAEKRGWREPSEVTIEHALIVSLP
jgi:hypothetical protein